MLGNLWVNSCFFCYSFLVLFQSLRLCLFFWVFFLPYCIHDDLKLWTERADNKHTGFVPNRKGKKNKCFIIKYDVIHRDCLSMSLNYVKQVSFNSEFAEHLFRINEYSIMQVLFLHLLVLYIFLSNLDFFSFPFHWKYFPISFVILYMTHQLFRSVINFQIFMNIMVIILLLFSCLIPCSQRTFSVWFKVFLIYWDVFIT